MRRLLGALGLAHGASLGVTLALLVMEGRWQEALPLHLCSVSALAAIVLAFRPQQTLLDVLWYGGIPGAALALLFPAPAASRFQGLLNASYTVTHALILVTPLLRMAQGMRPRPGRSRRMLGGLLGLAALAGMANAIWGTDFLFLAAPPYGTPLEAVFAHGHPLYLLCLLGLALGVCRTMDALAGRIGK